MANRLKRLDVETTKVKTSYCISNDVREEQMLVAHSRISGRITPAEFLCDEEIAIVCYGPSLRKMWHELTRFKKIMTCSGAHKFLLDRGIVPTWHVDLDPREHKVKMLGTPHKNVEYLMASCCHPKMWDLLDGHNVKLWDIFNNEDVRDLPLVYPRGNWILTGGNNVGLRCMVVARLMGYTNQHVFGMDCSFPGRSSHHAGEHLNADKKAYEVPYAGKMFYCEPVMITYARQFFHEIKQLPDVKVNLYGDGLLQHMAYAKRDEKIEHKKSVALAFATPVTITPEYTEVLKKMHQNPIYGILGRKHAGVVLKLADSLKTHGIMDYGCGKGSLGANLPFPIWEYDPAIPGKDKVPRPADLVVCLNVLECVEPAMLDNVLGDLVRCSMKCVFAIIGTGSSDRDLPDGRNSHLIQQGKEWWSAKLNQFFNVGAIFQAGYELHCVLEPRKMGPLA